MLSKRGSSHVEIILAFTLFVGFAFFLLAYIQPTDDNFLENSILLGLRDKFFENVTINVSNTLVEIQGGSGCCKPKEMSNPSVCSNELKPNSQGAKHYYNFYSSSEFSDNIDECQNDNIYKIGYINTEYVVSNKNLIILNRTYYNNYDQLKQILKVPDVVDFAIIAGDVKMERIIPDNVDVQSLLYRRPILYENATTINTDFVFKVW